MNSKAYPRVILSKDTRSTPLAQQMKLYKEMYFKLHNLERHPDVLPEARKLLTALTSEALLKAFKDPDHGILSIEVFEPQRLVQFLQAEDHNITLRWEQYIARRKNGSPREMFKDADHAKWWLKQSAPVKYVDGAWLGHIHRVNTPFSLRHVTKNAWQVMSEELGDGDLTKNHAHIWRSLMDDTGASLPDGDSAEFGTGHGLDVPHVWKAALAQLLISLFPRDFLPEILGFNMQYEMLTWDTMRAVKELKELRLNNYYFLLHISIDNADSGHTAMAMQTVLDYMDFVRQSEGEAAAQSAWRRVQAGYLLSKHLPTSPERQQDAHEAEVLKIFKAKAPVAHRLHCSANIKIGPRTLVDWLDSAAWDSEEWQHEFIDALSHARPWIRRGDSGGSKLVQSLLWNGKMFGSFTASEVTTMRAWIDALAPTSSDPSFYYSFTNQTPLLPTPGDQDIRTDYPTFQPQFASMPPAPTIALSPSELTAPIKVSPRADLAQLLPLWFAHQALLESFASIPFQTTTPAASAVIRVLRAQYGFLPDTDLVRGMDEVRQSAPTPDIVGMGLRMAQKASRPAPAGLQDVVPGDGGFALRMLHWSMRPRACRDGLLGLAWAFAGLHAAVAAADGTALLDGGDKAVLEAMAHREREGLTVCLDELRGDEKRYGEFCAGYESGRREIEACFS